MAECKFVNIPLARHFILSKIQYPSFELEYLKMENIPYANVIGIIIYSRISTRPNLAYSISLLIRYMSSPGKLHWKVLKYVLKYINDSLNVGKTMRKEEILLT